MLLKYLELIVQYPQHGGYVCRGFRGLLLRSPAYVVFDGANPGHQPTANRLGQAFCTQVLSYAGATEESAMPCWGFRGAVGCHAMSGIGCRKILAYVAGPGSTVGPPGWPAPTAEAIWLANVIDPDWVTIPVIPFSASIATHVPTPWTSINVCRWVRDPVEAIWSLLHWAGLSPAENRIFISYVRAESSAVADQLFAALTQQGFDVFLDRCSVPVGVQFQERLMQDLCDKAVAVLLNTAGVAASHWVQEEIALLKTYRLGLLELQFPGVAVRKDIDRDFTRPISPSDLTSGTNPELTSACLDDVVERIKEEHAKALHRRRMELIDNFAAALVVAGRRAHVRADGVFVVPANAGGGTRLVSLASRPPELQDFSALHQLGNISPAQPGWLVSPTPFFIARRKADVAWLSGICDISHADEAQMVRLAANL